MEEITEQEANNLIEQEKERINKILEYGGKFIKIVIEEKDKTTIITKIEPVGAKATSSTVVITKDEMNIKNLKDVTVKEIKKLKVEDFKNKKSEVAGTTTECSISTPQEVQKKIISEILTIDGKHITN